MKTWLSNYSRLNCNWDNKNSI